MRVWVILASVLMMLGGMFGCKGRVVTEYISRDGDDGLREVDSTIKRDLDKMGIINPTGLNIKLNVRSRPRVRPMFTSKKFQGHYKDKNGVHYITAKAGKDGVNVTEWEIVVTKKNATNLALTNIAISTAQHLPRELSTHVEIDGAGGVVGRYFYDVEYKANKSDEFYVQPVVTRVRDVFYCERMVRKLQTDGSLEDEKVGDTIPDVSVDTDCRDPSHTFNFDQKVVVNLMVDNDQAYALLIDEQNRKNAAVEACVRLGALAVGMGLAKDHLKLEQQTVENAETGKEETTDKAKLSWANAIRFGVQAIYSVYSIYTSFKLQQDGMNCKELGLEEGKFTRAIGGLDGGKGQGGPQGDN